MNNSQESMKVLDRWVWLPLLAAHLLSHFKSKSDDFDWLDWWSVGFLFLMVFAARHPVRLRSPWFEHLAPREAASGWRDYFGLLGLSFLVVGLIWRFIPES